MSVSSEIDRLLRHSWLARAQPFIRARTPWLHRALLAGRDILLPFQSAGGLTRYQYSAVERFASLADRPACVLEIGSDVDGCVLRELARRRFRQVIGLNVDAGSAHVRAVESVQPYQFVQADARRLPFRHCTVDAAISIAAFEHIHDLAVALLELHRVIKPGGIVYSAFGPIWSSSVGHHVYAVADGLEARHWKPGKNPVPHYGHLLMTAGELRDAVCRKPWVSANLADAIVEWIYTGAGVNRLFYEDYVRIFGASPFRVSLLDPVREHVPGSVQKRLEAAYPGYVEFGVRMAEVVLQKD